MAACCCITKTDVVNYEKKHPHQWNDEKVFETVWDLKVQIDYKLEIDKMLNLMSKKWIKTLSLEDGDFLQTDTTSPSNTTISEEIECILEQDVFENLMKLTDFRIRTVGEENSIEEIRDYICDILENNELMMNLASTLIQYGTFNEERFDSTFIAKKMIFHAQEIERLFTLFLRKMGKFDMIDTFKILTALKSVFGINFHPAIGMRIRKINLKICLNWIVKQMESSVDINDEKLNELSYENFLNVKNGAKIRYLAMTTLAQYLYYGEGENTEDVVENLKDVLFYVNDNVDLHAIIEILDIFGNQVDVPHQAVKWIWLGIVNLCKYHKEHIYVMKRLVEKIDKIVNFSKGLGDMTSSVIELFRIYSKLCSHLNIENRKYNLEVALIFLEKFRYFHQNFFKLCIDEAKVREMYTNVVYNFLSSKSFAVSSRNFFSPFSCFF